MFADTHTHTVFRFKYQLIVVGGCEVGMSVGNQEQLAVGVDGEETQEVLDSASYKVCHGLGLGLRHGLGTTVGVGTAVRWHPNRCKMLKMVTVPIYYWSIFNVNTIVFSLEVLENSGTQKHTTMFLCQVGKLSIIYVIFIVIRLDRHGF